MIAPQVLRTPLPAYLTTDPAVLEEAPRQAYIFDRHVTWADGAENNVCRCQCFISGRGFAADAAETRLCTGQRHASDAVPGRAQDHSSSNDREDALCDVASWSRAATRSASSAILWEHSSPSLRRSTAWRGPG